MNLWLRQTVSLARFELNRFLLARRWIGVYVMALAPVLVMYARAHLTPREVDPMSDASEGFAVLFQFFIMRFGVFIGSAVVFTQVFRGDILEKTLHLYLLAPVRREIIAAGKYLAGVVFVGSLHRLSCGIPEQDCSIHSLSKAPGSSIWPDMSPSPSWPPLVMALYSS
jgi:ABC-type transport system involved in multi-copper enzyme maturation permease subunit